MTLATFSGENPHYSQLLAAILLLALLSCYGATLSQGTFKAAVSRGLNSPATPRITWHRSLW